MSDQVLAHEMIDVAALYALGALSQQEARAFEDHLALPCDVCSSELRSFERTVGALAFSAAEEAPPERARIELLDRINELGTSADRKTMAGVSSKDFISVLAGEGEWQEVQAGVLLKKLSVDQSTGIATSLVRMLPGMSLPRHQHLGIEQFFVIEGDCNVRGQKLGPGDYHRAEAGTIHDTTYTVNGTMFLLVAPESYEILDAR